jgi:hypothetical protein
MRRIVQTLNISVADVLGLVGLLALAAAAGQFDPRFPAVVLAVGVLLIAVALAREEAAPPTVGE